MIELKTSYSLSWVPYVTNDALDAYAEDIIADFAPERLILPGPIDAEGFVEYYLGLNVEFHRICYDRKILSMIAFDDGIVQVMDEQTGMPEPMIVEKGTVVVDTSLSAKRNLARMRFSIAHEGSHWLLHRKAFAADNPFGSPGMYENPYLAAKEGRMDYRRDQRMRTDSERMERQADFLAAAILMPRPAMRVAFRHFFVRVGMKPRTIVRGASPMDDCFAKQLPDYVADIFQVSKRAALIRLEKLGGITGATLRASESCTFCYKR
jgi:Zn-dependent peptidase ImmA (M78 family)